MSSAYHKYPNDRKGQATIFSPKPTSPVGMFANEDYLGEPQDLEVKSHKLHQNSQGT